ncbi:MAG: RluA family pseudouridine synthase [Bacteroidales bacterium]|nr:RluA family pseudouridine synthase [Bacteroidales bacterium]
MLPLKFTYPFRYTPHPLVEDAARRLIADIDASPELASVFAEGKMLGVLVCSAPDGTLVTLRAFSGLAGGRSTIDGFVPPIFDTLSIKELWISADGTSAPKTRATLGSVRGGTVNEVNGGVERKRDGLWGTSTSAHLQERLFRSYQVHNAKGEMSDVKRIFEQRGLVPPGGTGECAGAKLLEAAYRRGLKSLAMGEFWYGASPKSGEVRQHGRFYPSCTGKCGPLLSWMMQGLDVEDNPLQRKPDDSQVRILYEDDAILVANKPSGMLCAPGLTGTESLQELLEKDHGKLFSCHRLDMDTSGVIVYAKSVEYQADIQQQFERREVRKTYLAHLVAGSRPWRGKRKGTIALPLSADYYDRPRQMVDRENGKPAITEFEILDIFPDGEIDVRFTPRTGRTHQIRVHCASPLGLGRPIKGDALYGAPSTGRLELYAESLSFRHPVTGETETFSI